MGNGTKIWNDSTNKLVKKLMAMTMMIVARQRCWGDASVDGVVEPFLLSEKESYKYNIISHLLQLHTKVQGHDTARRRKKRIVAF